MRASYRLTPKAAEGLWRIVQFVAERFDQDIAERVLDQLEEAFERLAEHPGIGHRRTDLTAEADVRFWSVGPTVIAFRERPGCIEVLCVEPGQRDWEKLLPGHIE